MLDSPSYLYLFTLPGLDMIPMLQGDDFPQWNFLDSGVKGRCESYRCVNNFFYLDASPYCFVSDNLQWSIVNPFAMKSGELSSLYCLWEYIITTCLTYDSSVIGPWAYWSKDILFVFLGFCSSSIQKLLNES